MTNAGAEGPLLRVENLSVTYQSMGETVRAVDGISFSVKTGEVFALVGESGSGKSSAALALTKLLPMPPAAISGQVVFDGRNLLEMDTGALRGIRGGKIAYVFQDPATTLNPVLTIGEQLTEAISLHTPVRGREAMRVATEWLERVGIASGAKRLGAYPHEFSGGMQQRVCLAMAMAVRPALLIADEPTTALDVTVQVQILRLLRDLQRTLGLSVLLISHDLLVVERIAHRVGVMSVGKLIECGDAVQVLRQPVQAYTKALLRARAAMSLRHGLRHG